MMRSQFAAMHSQPGVPAPPKGMMETMAVIGALFAMAWGSALPVFMLIWFSRPSIRRETADWT
jgi:hypothetical protein